MKLGILGIFAIPTVVFLILGMALNGFKDWQKHTGNVLFFSGAFTALGVLTMACVMNTKEFAPLMAPHVPALILDYVNGLGGIALSLSAGTYLIYREKRNSAQE